MKKITLQLALIVLILVFSGSVYSQTAVANTIRLTSLSPANGGTTSTATPMEKKIDWINHQITRRRRLLCYRGKKPFVGCSVKMSPTTTVTNWSNNEIVAT